MSDRVFVEWADGTWLSSTHHEFQAALAEQVAQSGQPTLVEFRAAGEGYTHAEPCEDCGLSLVKCACDDPPSAPEPSETSRFLGTLHDLYKGRYGHLLTETTLPEDLNGLPHREE